MRRQRRTQGLAASFNRPGRNATGVTLLTNSLEPKRFSLLRDLVQGTSLIGVLHNPNFPAAGAQLRDVQEAAERVGVKIQSVQPRMSAGGVLQHASRERTRQDHTDAGLLIEF
jgi:ABC-type uncharacterized transport system substrate-binding protein